MNWANLKDDNMGILDERASSFCVITGFEFEKIQTCLEVLKIEMSAV